VAKSWIAAAFFSLSLCAGAFEDSALWLPASYQKLAPELRQAAKKLEATETCDKVLRGYLHDSSRSMEEAVFLLVCRAPDRKTFSVLADAHSLELKYPLAVKKKAKQPVAVDVQKRVDTVWKACQTLYKDKTKFMRNLETLTEGQPHPEVDATGGAVGFVVDFDAESLQGATLRYRASCSSPDDKTPPKLVIRARKP
tara:strand:- start:326 stop:916 length:591 start_codon:yes stop_codon:yes gene_type:complete